MQVEPITANEMNAPVSFSGVLMGRGEEVLVAAAKTGDNTAFENLVAPEQKKLFHVAQRILRNREDAEDVVQGTLLKAFQYLNGFAGNSRFSTWLVRIATNEALMKLRTRRRHHELPIDLPSEDDGAPLEAQLLDSRPNPEESCSESELRTVLREAMEQLKAQDKEVFDLRFVRGLSAAETARILGVSVSTVKARLHRARQKVKAQAQEVILARRREAAVVESRRRTRRRRVLSVGYVPRVEMTLLRYPMGA